MRTASPKLDTTELYATDEALLRCRTALELRDRGNYDGAQEVMRPLWKGIGTRPEIGSLHSSIAAEVLLCAGILTGWIGSRNEIKQADNSAKDLITESIALFESLGDLRKVAEARTELAYCYWRAGSLDEARIMFNEALQKLTTAGNTRANALLGLSVVEWTSSRHDEALKILTENAPLFAKITNHTLRGFYHNQLALVLRSLATNETKSDYFLRAVKEYEEADREFKRARNTVYRAHVKNNLGFLLFKLSRFRKAHEYLEHARRLTVNVRDRVRTAQVDETRAQVFIAEHKYSQGEIVSQNAARSFEKAGRQCFLAEALTTHGIALARRGKTVQAQFAFRKAIEVASQAGSLNTAGIAALTMIEELDDLPPELLSGAYEQAGEWLSDSQSQEVWHRFRVAGKKLALKLRVEAKGEVASEILFDKPQNLKRDLLQVEREMIRKALTKANGSLTRAAKLLDLSYQALAYLIQSRHPELLEERSPIRRRGKKHETAGEK
jgi:tetratricopeptide (TPR) repeat protein